MKAKIAEFGERVWHLESGSVSKDKLDVRWQDGVWFGVRDESGESIVGTPEGLMKCKDFRRRPEEGGIRESARCLRASRGSKCKASQERSS